MNRSIRARSSVRADRRRLPDVARHVVLPKDIATTGWPKVEARRGCAASNTMAVSANWSAVSSARPLMECMSQVSAAWSSAFADRWQDVFDRHDDCDAVHPERLLAEGAVDRA